MILSLLWGLLSLSSFTTGALTSGDYVFEMYDESSVIITGYNRDMAEKLTIPSKLGGYPVKAIGEDAFSEKEIYAVTLPDTLEVIEDFAFWNTAISSVTIPKNVSYIGIGAFSGGLFSEYKVSDGNKTFRAHKGILYNSSYSELLSFPTMGTFSTHSNTKTIGPYAFFYAYRISGLAIPASVTYIAEGAFMYSALRDLRIYSTMEYINDYAFYGCENLIYVTVDSQDVVIAPTAFEETKWLSSQDDGMIYFNTTAYLYKGTAPKKVVLKEDTTRLNGKAFAKQETVEQIVIPASTKEIHFSAFDECSSLTDISVDKSNTSFKSIDGMLYSYDGTELYVCPAGKKGVVNVPEKTIRIEDYAFEYCEKTTEITLPSSLTEIGEGAFFGCSALEKIEIPYFVKTNGGGIFFGCTSLKDIKIPEGSTIFTVFDFLDTSWLEEQPDGVLYLCKTALSYKEEFENTSEFAIDEGTLAVADYAFFGFETLENVTLPKTLTAIGEYAFLFCDNMKEITIPASVDTIGEKALGYSYSYNEATGAETFTPVDGFVIKGFAGTAAESYANSNNFEFVALADLPVSDILGDVDGDFKLSVRDATTIQKKAVSLIEFDENQMKVADFNFDGNINVRDATAIQKRVAGLPD